MMFWHLYLRILVKEVCHIPSRLASQQTPTQTVSCLWTSTAPPTPRPPPLTAKTTIWMSNLNGTTRGPFTALQKVLIRPVPLKVIKISHGTKEKRSFLKQKCVITDIINREGEWTDKVWLGKKGEQLNRIV